MKRLRKIPDFGKYFHTNSPSPIDFTCRTPPNLFHDLVFLKSYVHDARLRSDRLCLRDKTLQVPMERDRWELYDHLGKLESISCDLTISPVLAIAWESNGRLLRRESLRPGEEFAIREVYLGEPYWDDPDKGEIVFSGHGKRPSKLRITVGDLFSIHLKDHTEKRPGNRRVRLAR